MGRSTSSVARRRMLGDALMGYAFVGPALILFLLFQGYPIVRGLIIAFSDYQYLIPDWQPFNGVNNWVEIWGDRTFWAALGRSGYYTALYVAGMVVIGLLVAVLIAAFRNPVESSAYRVIAYMPVVLPIAVALPLWRQLLNNQFGYVKGGGAG